MDANSLLAALGGGQPGLFDQAAALMTAMAAQPQTQPQMQQVQPMMAVEAPRPPQNGGAPMAGQQIPGVTDRRWEGVLISVMQEKGFGFIRCPELKDTFPNNDIFLHKNQMGSYQQGDAVSFSVFINRSGKPNANELQPTVLSSTLQNVLQAGSGGRPPNAQGGGGGGGSMGMLPAPPASGYGAAAPQSAQAYQPVAAQSMQAYNAAPAQGAQAQSQPGTSLPPAPPPPVTRTAPQAQAPVAQDGVVAAAPQPPAPMPTPTPPVVQMVVKEIEVPSDCVAAIIGEAGAGLDAIKQRAGGDVRVEFGSTVNNNSARLMKIFGPAVSASLAACLVLERVSELL